MQEKIINDKILEMISLENVFKIFNDNIFPMLNDEERAYCNDLQTFCLELQPKIDKSKDVYVLFPELGKHGYMQRINKWRDFTPYGMKKEILLGTHLSLLDPQLELARLASGILCGNPTFHYYTHGGTGDTIQKVQDELMSGLKIGAIGITEPERGSDAVNLTTVATKTDDGIIYNGEKVYTTNGPKADYICAYGVYNTEDPRSTMVQAMIKREFGVNILADNGLGYTRLFEGLVPERLGIMGSGIGVCWSGLIYGIIYTNLRTQFGKPVIRYQGVGYGLADLLTKATAATSLALQSATIYDEKILFADKPSKEAEKWVASISSQGKYYTAKLTHEICYEVQQHMGGVSVTDNTPVDELVDVSKIEEVIGGARNIQLLLIQSQIQRFMNLL